MPEVTLELLGVQSERIISELREIKMRLDVIETDMASLARVMLRFESRVNKLEAGE